MKQTYMPDIQSLFDECCIYDTDRDKLKRFFNLLFNRAHNELTVPYGLLISYNSVAAADDFYHRLAESIEQLAECEYRTMHITEEELLKISLRQEKYDRKSIIFVTDLSSQGSLAGLINRFQENTSIIPVILANHETVKERISPNEDFYYRRLCIRINIYTLTSKEITNRFINDFKQSFSTTQSFDEEIAYYIDTVYEEADFKNQEFIDDLKRRLLIHMEEQKGVPAYQEGIRIDESFVPYSSKVNYRKKTDKEMQEYLAQVSNTSDVYSEKLDEADVCRISEIPKDQKELNVLLLSLSTFPSKMKKRQFAYEFGGVKGSVNGIYQLDPVPEMLNQNGIKLDYVIMLCTKKVENEKEIDVEDYKGSISPVQYFKRHLRDKMRYFLEEDANIVSINIDEKPAEAIRTAVDHLQNLNKDRRICLYVDAHGGLRETQTSLEAILSLLKNSISNQTIYNVELSPEDDNGRITIDEANRLFDFVSGINEFSNYGRIESLENYLEDSKNNALTQPIKNISEGIQWCDINSFESGLKELRKYFHSPDKNVEDIYLQLFEEHIKNDYGELLESETEFDVEIGIRWCLKKGFYQQALTLLEARMPDMWRKKGILKLTASGEKFADKKVFTYIYNGLIYKKTPELWIWDTGIRTYNRKEFNSFFEKEMTLDKRVKKITEYVKQYCRKKKIDKDLYIKKLVFSNTDCSYNFDNAKEYEKSVGTFSCSTIHGFTNSKEEILFSLLFLHNTFKDIRNKSNHALDYPYKQQAVKNALWFYVDMFSMLSR